LPGSDDPWLCYKAIFPASEFDFDPIRHTSTCPAGHTQHSEQTRKDKAGNEKTYFVGRVSHCRPCTLKSKCMTTPQVADEVNG